MTTTKFYRSSESGPEELVLTPRATDAMVEAAADRIKQSISIAREDAVWLARAALAAAQAVAPTDVDGLAARLRNFADVLFRKEQDAEGQLLRDAAMALARAPRALAH